MGTRSAGRTIQIGVTVYEVTKSHGLTTGVRHKLELVLNEVKNCFELALSSLVKDI